MRGALAILLAVAVAAAVVSGCGVILPDPAAGPPIRVVRTGLDVNVTVRDWTRPKAKIVLCAAPVPDAQLGQLLTFPVPRRDCLEVPTVHAGLELTGSYSFRDASATRRADFDAAQSWYVIIAGLDQAAPKYTQVRVTGGPVAAG